MKIHIHTLGCKVNQFESQALETLFTQRGHTVTADESGCDAVIINTCAVTAESVRKSRQAIRHFKSENPGAVIGICGCWPQAEPENAKELGGDVIYGSSDHSGFAADIEAAFSCKKSVCNVDNVFSRREFESLPAGSSVSRTRALLKIEDGCVNFCSYCIIPYTRGPVRSLALDSISKEASSLASQGYREIVLTGIEIASYGQDLRDGSSLSDAVCTAAQAAPGCRIRLGSLEPRVITDDFCKRISKHKNICDHFHLSLQSGCDDTLKRMKRKYDTALFYKSVELLRSYFPGCGITADLITGFPGESEEEFSQTISFIEKCAFSSMHIFPYSVRGGTVAAGLDGQIDKHIKQARAKLASKSAKVSHDAFLASQIGSVQEVLFEQKNGGLWEGHAKNYALVAASGENLHNAVRNVQITGIKSGILLGDIIL
ncbi:MAG: tRNA (N(6)-L-threonylcarbamoyladenosine(37)-C(2))-methylthiotransferase MtaB [Oscillospiraceae bacterium]